MRIHWFSPLAPARTEIGRCTARILPALCSRAEVTLWTSQPEWDSELEKQAEVRRFAPGCLPRRCLETADAVFFNIGNSSMFHRDIWQICREYPGVVILHDGMLHDAVVNHCRIAPEVEGAYPDGWTSDRLAVSYAAGEKGRRLTVRLGAPDWLPHAVSRRVYELPAGAGRIEIPIFPTREVDGRTLGCRWESIEITGPGGTVLLGGRQMYFDLMESMYGPRGRRDAGLHWRGVLSLDQMSRVYSCVPFILPAARGVVVHSHLGERMVRRESRLPVACLEMPAPQGVPAPQAPGGPPWHLVTFGYFGPNRGIGSILEALRLLEERSLFRLHIHGVLHDPAAVKVDIERLGLREIATLHGPATEAELDDALSRAHLAINLRYPTRGEASAAQLRIWRHALPGIVTRIGWYAEQPADTVAFVRPHSMAEDLAALLRRFAAAPHPFIEMGRNGYRRLAAHHTPGRYVDRLLELAAQ